MIQAKAIQLVDQELARARFKFPEFRSAHEGYAIILEEVRELEREVFKNQSIRSLASMRREAIQVAAMAIRFITDIED